MPVPSYPVLSTVIFFPLFGALIILFLKRETHIKTCALLTTLVNLFLGLSIVFRFDKELPGFQFVEDYLWIEALGVSYKIGVDGVGVLFVLLSLIISVLCVLCSWNSIKVRVRDFYALLLITETIMIGVFCALDLFLFYVFWEALLIPMFLLIGIWGSSKRIYASVKFVLFTFAGSVLMLIGIMSLYFMGGKTFDLLELQKIQYPLKYQVWLFLAFFAAFAIKVPMFPFHTWLPDAHTEAPTAGSVILAGILLKVGAYGFIRFCFPLCPMALPILKPYLQILSVVAIIYGAFVTLLQTDIKRLIAYSSISHMGYVTLGIFTTNKPGLEGAILQMINHGIVTGALFIWIGAMYDRFHTREIAKYGELGRLLPGFVVALLIFSAAAIGFPGTNSFVGEFLIALGTFKDNQFLGFTLILGFLLGTAYMIWLFYRVTFLELTPDMKETFLKEGAFKAPDLREIVMFVSLGIFIFALGLKPNIVLSFLHTPLDLLLNSLLK
ncbi:MAG: NADH-quinone oxidoreductase subunit M [Caldimicrobium sp.]|nr:NADH-quinone oxidoreductase subunit M [Caldimicrobium sp.]MCX7613973.1 NADH-quinone oxidoreductase subunit M [Caldimicrobium sp.]MDW8182320.1 NADH-quinone oxidoreductase subunit M [Caldimicrobium sp.]